MSFKSGKHREAKRKNAKELNNRSPLRERKPSYTTCQVTFKRNTVTNSGSTTLVAERGYPWGPFLPPCELTPDSRYAAEAKSEGHPRRLSAANEKASRLQSK